MKNIKYLFLLFVVAFIQCKTTQRITTTPATIQDKIRNDKSCFFYLDTKNYPAKDKSLPIGVFDSGTGGLTVLDAIVNYDEHDNTTRKKVASGDRQRDFNKEYFIYLGDKANMPYGAYSGNHKTDLLKEHILKDMQFLLGNKYYLSAEDKKYQTDKSPVKAIVIACNTATAYGKDDIQAFCRKSGIDIPVIGVIDAGVRGALEHFQAGESGIVGIMATAGTVASKGYPKTIVAQKKALKYTGNIESYQQAGVGLAAAIDGETDFIDPKATEPRANYRGPSFTNEIAKIDKNILQRYGFDWSSNHVLFKGTKENPVDIQLNSIENYIAYHVVSLLETIRKSGSKEKLKAIILGCTHFPFFTDIFNEKLQACYDYRENGVYIYRQWIGEKVFFVDPAINTAKELYDYLHTTALFNNSSIDNSEFYISVPNPLNKNNVIDEKGNFPYAYKYGRKAGEFQQYVKRVPFSKRSFPVEVRNRLEKKIPFTFELIRAFEER